MMKDSAGKVAAALADGMAFTMMMDITDKRALEDSIELRSSTDDILLNNKQKTIIMSSKDFNELNSKLLINKPLLDDCYALLDELVKLSNNGTIHKAAVDHREKLNLFIESIYGSRIHRDAATPKRMY